MYLPVAPLVVFDLPPMKRFLVTGAPLHVAADATPFRWLCDVQIN
jgi:hypothetical protein